ncbi:MAG: hypothetical protein MUE40_02995 [Anaerolineae bacterium]|jgi:ABC-type Fe2+-enterobactin transport system substrate-binding protein|nr:hypothetical protein [Anaerolineae bacterium]
MTTTNPILVFSGSAGLAAALADVAERRGWCVFYDSDMLGTLGQVTFFYPDLVIIEDTGAAAQTVYMHLASVNTEPLLILSDQPSAWDVPAGAAVTILPRQMPLAALCAAVLRLTQDDPHAQPA